MKIVLFYHSLLSCWNHGNAHFLRGVVRELIERGHEVQVFEPRQGWSLQNLLGEYGTACLDELRIYYPGIFGENSPSPEEAGSTTAEELALIAAAKAEAGEGSISADTLKLVVPPQSSVLAGNVSQFYDLESLDLDAVLHEADLVLVHEWNDHELVRRIGEHRVNNEYKLLFHDTHHRAVTERESMANYDLQHYDGVLAFGNIIRDIYLREGWTKNAWTWHEAADASLFYPRRNEQPEGDLIWIGNWGDEERTAELHEFLINPVKELGLKAKIYGVRYPEHALKALADAGIEYGGWLPNYKAPQEFAKYKVTVHVPRRPYVEALPGIPTIRPFEALACGIPLVSSPWNDAENLFTSGKDFLVAKNGEEMKQHLSCLLQNSTRADELSRNGIATIRTRHTCGHRVNELEAICEELGIDQCKIHLPAKQITVNEEIIG